MFFVNDEGICRIFALGDTAQHQPLGQSGRQIFEGMHRKVDSALHHAVFQLLREQTLIANF